MTTTNSQYHLMSYESAGLKLQSLNEVRGGMPGKHQLQTMSVRDVCQYYNDLDQKLVQPKGDPNQQQLLIP